MIKKLNNFFPWNFFFLSFPTTKEITMMSRMINSKIILSGFNSKTPFLVNPMMSSVYTKVNGHVDLNLVEDNRNITDWERY